VANHPGVTETALLQEVEHCRELRRGAHGLGR